MGGLALVGVVVVAVGLFLRPAPAAQASAPAPALTVALGMARIQLWPTTIEASGAVAAWQETIIGGQIGGLQIREVLVNVGDQVRQGQLLARFDATAPRVELSRLVAALRQAQAGRDQAEANRARAQSLAASGAISAQEVLRYATEAAAAQAAMEAAEAAVAAQREQLRYVEVRASDDGLVISRAATVGSVGGVGQELFRLIRYGRLEWRGELTAEQLAKASARSAVTLTLPDGSVAKARVRQAAPALNAETRLGLLYADLVDPASARAGMYVRGRIDLPPAPALTVPATSVVLRDGRNYLFGVSAVGGHLTVRQHEVVIGRRFGAEVELLSGGPADGKFVISGGGFLKAGDVVHEARPAPGLDQPVESPSS